MSQTFRETRQAFRTSSNSPLYSSSSSSASSFSRASRSGRLGGVKVLGIDEMVHNLREDLDWKLLDVNHGQI